MSKVDMELKKAFAELQVKAIETQQKMKLADIQINNLQNNKKRTACTEAELLTLDGDYKMYESIGRMFMLTPKAELLTDLRKKQTEADEKIKTLENSQAYLERSMKDAENNIREMVQARK